GRWYPSGGIGFHLSRRIALDVAAFGTKTFLEQERRVAVAVSLRLEPRRQTPEAGSPEKHCGRTRTRDLPHLIQRYADPRSAVVGLTRAARNAGTSVATAATARSTSGSTTNVSGSRLPTPKRSD